MKESNAFVIATKIRDTFEIGQIVGIFEGKFKMMTESWFLEKNADGINIYTDKKDVFQGFSKQYLLKDEAQSIIDNQEELIKSNNKPRVTDFLSKAAIILLFLTNTSAMKDKVDE